MYDELDHAVRVIAIDPGSRFLGIAILDVFIDEGRVDLLHTHTLEVEKYLRQEKTRVEHYGEFAVRMEYVNTAVYDTCVAWRPTDAVHESPYMGDRAMPFARLTQINMSIAHAINRYDPSIQVHSINPASVKTNVGVPGNSSDKELMRKAVSGIANLQNRSEKSFGALTEHEIDSTAVGYHRCCYGLGIPRRLG